MVEGNLREKLLKDRHNYVWDVYGIKGSGHNANDDGVNWLSCREESILGVSKPTFSNFKTIYF